MSEVETKKEEQIVVLKEQDGVKVLLGQFEEGNIKGLRYAYPQVDSGAAADAYYGAEVIAKLLNAVLKLKTVAKVKNNKLSFGAGVTDIEQAQILGRMAAAVVDGQQGMVWSVEDALNFKPGERELGPKKQIQLKIDEAMAALKEGGLTPDKAQAIFQEIALLQAKLTKTPEE